MKELVKVCRISVDNDFNVESIIRINIQLEVDKPTTNQEYEAIEKEVEGKLKSIGATAVTQLGIMSEIIDDVDIRTVDKPEKKEKPATEKPKAKPVEKEDKAPKAMKMEDIDDAPAEQARNEEAPIEQSVGKVDEQTVQSDAVTASADDDDEW